MSAAGLGGRSPVSVIRQVAILMALSCGLVTALLLLMRPPDARRQHTPEHATTALLALVQAIRPVVGTPAALPDAQALRRLWPACAARPPADHQGLPWFDDLAEQAAQLDQHLARLAGAGSDQPARNALLAQRYQLDTAAWIAEAGRSGLGCEASARALRRVAGPGGPALLAQARWREQSARAERPERPDRAAQRAGPAGTPRAPTPTPAVTVAAQVLAQSDPWRGWPGCTWLGEATADGRAHYVLPAGQAAWGRQLCAQPGAMPRGARQAVAAEVPTVRAGGTQAGRGASGWAVPRDLAAMLAELEALRLPEGKLYTDYLASLPEGSNLRALGRSEVEVGFNLHLTIAPATQALAQQLADCYTGRTAACAAAGVNPAQLATAGGAPGIAQLWEGAAARMTAVAVLDAATGRIEALAGAYTPCYAQEHDGPARDAGCTPLWTKPRLRRDNLLNPAVFTDHTPGSTIKPILASVFFEDASVPPAALAQWLAASKSHLFNDLLFCTLHAPKGECSRPQRVQQRAAALGWNSDCTDQPGTGCGQADLLFGRPLSARLDDAESLAGPGQASPLQRRVMVGRLLVAPTAAAGDATGAHQRMPLEAADLANAASCRVGGEWHAAACRNLRMKRLVNEAFGQGQARATALGVATMVARLAAAARGQAAVRRPFLVDRLSDAQGRPVATAALRDPAGPAAALAPPLPLDVAPAVARQVLDAMALGSRPGGTAHRICQHVFGAQCEAMGPRFAGKTGTPSFSFDKLTLAQAVQTCRQDPKDEDCGERPVKWYVAAYASQPGGLRNKVVAVLSERNWYQRHAGVPVAFRDRVQDAKDSANISAELAMRLMAAQWATPAPSALSTRP